MNKITLKNTFLASNAEVMATIFDTGSNVDACHFDDIIVCSISTK
jgi:hypothetical protein